MKMLFPLMFVTIFTSCNELKNPLNEMEMFKELMDNHYSKIFPNRQRNSGGPMFFKYIHENLAKNHEEFVAYNKFYCGVSGSIIMPDRPQRYTTVKIRNKDNKCIKGNYYRCRWPCSGDIMKYSRVDTITIKLPNDIDKESREYNVLTINDPCGACVDEECSNFPKEVGAFKCKNGKTSNGLRVRNGKITKGKGRLIFSLFHKPKDKDEFDPNFLKQCSQRHNASLNELEKMGGMGNIFVKLALLDKKETFELCGN